MRSISVTEAERLLGEAKWQEAADKREAKNKARRERYEAKEWTKRKAERIAEVVTLIAPYINADVAIEFDPEREGTLTLHHPTLGPLIITASGDDMTFLSIG